MLWIEQLAKNVEVAKGAARCFVEHLNEPSEARERLLAELESARAEFREEGVVFVLPSLPPRLDSLASEEPRVLLVSPRKPQSS